MKNGNNKIRTSFWRTVLVLLVLLGGIELNAQNVSRKEQLESQKVAFFTRQLNLTVEEAQVFWPVYNEYQQKNESLSKTKRKLLVQLEGDAGISEKEIETISDRYIALQLDQAKLASQYHEKFKTVLPIRKVIAYYRAEQKYKRFLLQQFQKNRKPDNN